MEIIDVGQTMSPIEAPVKNLAFLLSVVIIHDENHFPIRVVVTQVVRGACSSSPSGFQVLIVHTNLSQEER